MGEIGDNAINIMKNIIIISCAAILLMTSFVMAEEQSGGYSGSYMKLSVEARPAAMGGAYFAISDDAAGQLYNPAGVAASRDRIFTSSYRAMSLDRSMGFVSYVMPTRKESSLGFSWQFVGSGSVDVRNRNGGYMGMSLSSNEHIFAVNFAKQFLPSLAFGAKLNYYLKGGGTIDFDEGVLYDLNTSSIGINLGAMLYVDSLFEYGTMEGKPINDIKVGLVFDNMAARYNWSSNEDLGLIAAPEDVFPIIAGIGLSFRTFQRNLLVAVDFEKVEKRPLAIKFGGEYKYNNKFALRTGLDDGIITAGLGYQFDMGENNYLEFDYAFSNARVEEGSDHLFGFHFRF